MTTYATPICVPTAAPGFRSVENPAVPLDQIFYEYDDLGAPSKAGVRVNRRRALGYSAIWRGVNLIAGSLGRLRPRVYRKAPGGGKTPDPAHPAHRLLRRPNAYMGGFTFRQTLQAHALLDGNGYSYVIRDPATALPSELLILDPSRTYPVRVNGELWYVTQVPTRRNQFEQRKLPHTDVIHVRGLGFDGLVGYPVVKILRDTIGNALAARDYGTRYFANDARPGLVLEVPAAMKDAAIANLRQSWGEMHQGVENAHKVGILRDGVKLQQIERKARDAQLIENREFDAREVANVLGVPPHKVGDPSRTAYNSLESENQSFYDDTLDGWLFAWEEELDDKLLTEEEKAEESHCVEFVRNELLRTNLAARGTFYQQGLQNGWLCADEIRAPEGLNAIPGGLGQVFYRPSVVVPVGAEPADPGAAGDDDPGRPDPPTPGVAPNPNPGPGAETYSLRDALRAAAADVFARMARRVATHGERSAKRRPDWVRWLVSGTREHADTVREALSPFVVARDAAGLAGPELADLTAAFCLACREAFEAIPEDASDLPAAVGAKAEEFEAAARTRFPLELIP